MTEPINKWEELEKLKAHLCVERDYCIEGLIEKLDEFSEFNRGFCRGYISAIDEALNYIRDRFKYNE